MTAARPRGLAWFGIALLLALALAVAAVLVERRAIARAVVDAQLRALGLEEVWHEVDRLGLAEFGIRDLRVGGDGDLEIDRVDARYSLRSLWAGQLEEITLAGVRLKGRVDAAGVHFGALDPALAGGAGGAREPAPLALPARSVSVADFRLELATEQGPVRAGFDAKASEIDGAVELVGDFAGSGSGPRPEGPGRAPVPVAVDFSFAGTVVPEGRALAFHLTATSRGQRIEVSADGTLDTASGAGDAELRLRPFELHPGDLSGELAVALLGQPFAVGGGEVGVLGRARWGAGQPVDAAVDLALRNLSLTSEVGSCERLDAAIRLEGPSPLRTPPGQLVSAARMDFGIELTNGFIDFQLLPDGVIELARARWTFAGGMIRTRGRADLGADTQELVLDLDEIDLGALLELVDLAGLSGTGRLNGRIPLVRRGGKLAIRGGRAAATDAGGVIRYAADPGLEAAAGQAADLGLVYGALANFQYDKLVASIDGDMAEPVTVAVTLAGANPDFMGGQPIEFNLTVESHLVDLLQKASAVYRLPGEIEKRIQEVSGASR